MQPVYDTIAIVGPGLIGASLGMAARRRGLASRVIGIGRRMTSLDEAMRVGALDECTLDLAEGLRDADLVVLATPISAISRLMPQVAAALNSGAVLTDVASTKQSVIRTITEALEGRKDVVYVPTHPMAGSEQRSAAHACAALFEGSVCIFTRPPDAPEPAVRELRALWEAVGARVHVMSPAEHDRLVARVSHLPHLAAAAMLEIITTQEGAFAGGGLLDTTRVASGDPALWRDICETNAEEVALAVQAYVEVLHRLHDLIRRGRFDDVQSLLQDAKTRRDDLLALRGPDRTGTDNQ